MNRYIKVFYLEDKGDYDEVVTLTKGSLSDEQYINMRNIIEQALLMTGKKVQVHEYLEHENHSITLSDG